MSQLVAVNVVHQIRPDSHNDSGTTAIDKRPVDGAVAVGALGLDGDQQRDVAHHGGRDKAVYAYAAEDSGWWAEQLGRELGAGQFGENLTTSGLDVTGAVIGEHWRIGDSGLVLEVTQPRTPCLTFQDWLGEAHWVKRFTERGAPGAYLRVVEAGTASAGDRIDVVHRPAHGVSVGAFFHQPTPDVARLLLAAAADGQFEMAPSLRPYTDRAAARP